MSESPRPGSSESSLPSEQSSGEPHRGTIRLLSTGPIHVDGNLPLAVDHPLRGHARQRGTRAHAAGPLGLGQRLCQLQRGEL